MVSVASGQIDVQTPDIRPYLQSGALNSPVQSSIRVVNLSTGFQASSTQNFQYGTQMRITSMGPTSGPFTGGTRVTIYGQGFEEPVAVSLGNIGQQVVSVTGTEVVFITSGINLSQCPAGNTVTANGVTVTNVEGGASASADIGFDYTVPKPTIFGISPNSGSVGSTTTISGQDFASNVQVLFGGVSGSTAQIVSNSATSITVKVPTPPPGFTFNTQPCDSDGDGNPGGTQNVATPISVTVQNLDQLSCSVTLLNAYTLNPTNTVCTGDTTASTGGAAPTASFTFAKAGLTVQFTDTSSGSPTAWAWDFGDGGSSFTQNPSHVYAVGGTYTVTLTAINAGGSDSTSQSVTVP